jgi:hypothetical protein
MSWSSEFLMYEVRSNPKPNCSYISGQLHVRGFVIKK